MDEQKPRVEGKIMPFEAISESWQEYNLADGNTLMLKMVLLKVLKTDKKAPSGEPLYNFQTHVVTNVYTKEQGYIQMKR